MSESSVVSDLINRVHSRRLQTDPADALLFGSASRGAPRALRAQDRWFESSVVEPVNVPVPQTVAPAPRARMPVAPPTQDRVRVRLLIAATIAAAVLGVYGASRVPIDIDNDAPAASTTSVNPPAVQSLPEVVPSAPVEQPQANIVVPADTTPAPPAPVVEANTQPTAAPTTAQSHHRAMKRKKVKRVKSAAKHSIASPASVAPARVRPTARAAQSADSESPL